MKTITLLNKLTMKLCSFTLLILWLSSPSWAMPEKQADILTEAIDNVWSGHRIKPYLLVRGNHQFVAYFDANRQMTVAHRTLGDKWRYSKVDSWLGWDSHNYVTMEIDKEGYIHVMGNMHADPLEYFRSTEPYNVRTLKRVPLLVDKNVEQRMTYPIFLLNKKQELIVKYRHGGSGNGNEIYNIYDTKTQTWSKLHNQQFLDGEGKMSGYFEGPTLGPDGNFHLIWVWRNTPNAATNHSLSYAMSDDLVHWQDSNGKPIELPLTLAKTEIVDPVPPFGGMINGNVKLGFDGDNKPVISYHKYDQNGNTQIYLAKKQGKGWKSKQISAWQDFRWEFGGHGSLGRFAVRPYAPELLADNTLSIKVRRNDDIVQFIVDAKTLNTISVKQSEIYPEAINALTKKSNLHMFDNNDFKLEHQVFKGVGDLNSKTGQHYLSWFSQPGNRDNAHSTISPSSVMLLHEIK